MSRRSKKYPAFTLNECIGFVSKIYELFGDSMYASRHNISEQLKTATNTLNTRFSASVQYNLLDMKVRAGYKPSALFKRIYRPYSEDEEYELKLKAMSNPPLYRKLFYFFNGKKLPKESSLANMLHREYQIYDKASRYASEIFFKNINDLNIISEEGILYMKNLEQGLDFEDVKEEIQSNGSLYTSLEEESSPKIGANQVPEMDLDKKVVKEIVKFTPQSRKIQILLPKRRTAELSIPEDLSSNDVEIIKKQIDVLDLYVQYND